VATRNSSASPSTGLRWADPPATARQSRNPDRYAAEAAELKANPGKWAVLTEAKTRSAAYSVKRGVEKATYPAFSPAGTYEAKTVSADGSTAVYVRYKATDTAAEGEAQQ
jgi:hypothetical protein